MGYEKFNEQVKGKYWEKYFKHDDEFYMTIQNHILKHIPKENTIGIDIGAGPSIGAHIFVNLEFQTEITGYEPSDTYIDGIELSEQFKEDKIQIKYTSIKGGISDINIKKENPVDYILILRAAHEIADSLKSKDNFFKELAKLTENLKEEGILIIADPQYLDENVSEEIIKKIQEYQIKNIGHCHVPSDYVTTEDNKKHIQAIGLEIIEETIIPDKKLPNFLKEEGINLKESPYGFYIQTFKK